MKKVFLLSVWFHEGDVPVGYVVGDSEEAVAKELGLVAKDSNFVTPDDGIVVIIDDLTKVNSLQQIRAIASETPRCEH